MNKCKVFIKIQLVLVPVTIISKELMNYVRRVVVWISYANVKSQDGTRNTL